MKLLLAEDERELSQAVVALLRYQGFDTDPAYDGEEALTMARTGRYDGILLDIMMPKRDGLSVLKVLREEGDTTPILMLTAKAEVADRVAGLDQGANDYLAKPFAGRELVARIRAMIRTQEQRVPSRIQVANIKMNREERSLEADGGSVSLSSREFLLLEQFLCHPGMSFSREQLTEKFCPGEAEALELYLSYLRHKLLSVGAWAEITQPDGGACCLLLRKGPLFPEEEEQKRDCVSKGNLV